ncbi:hypothetical protein BRYFOR_09377 [Marvinbryantia formatexigens DSM 14469]|uniref:Uncharacterized protein n=1 Tax=Marvinbryantia formatexigens DSM 14469 TaxID=478749 RepID=C6LL29_9FIRM|nr:hypothetical protein BRYFOR_09377 [Marvinbryantia formatexigens DSM 14469]
MTSFIPSSSFTGWQVAQLSGISGVLCVRFLFYDSIIPLSDCTKRGVDFCFRGGFLCILHSIVFRISDVCRKEKSGSTTCHLLQICFQHFAGASGNFINDIFT